MKRTKGARYNMSLMYSKYIYFLIVFISFYIANLFELPVEIYIFSFFEISIYFLTIFLSNLLFQI